MTRPGDPDYQLIAPPSFTALRTENWLYVESVDGGTELDNRQADPYAIHNVARSSPPSTVATLHAQLLALKTWSGATCRTADTLPEP